MLLNSVGFVEPFSYQEASRSVGLIDTQIKIKEFNTSTNYSNTKSRYISKRLRYINFFSYLKYMENLPSPWHSLCVIQ